MSKSARFLGATTAAILSLASAGPAGAVEAAELLANSVNVQGVFEAAPDGSIRHIQSGLVCPIRFPNLELWRILVFPSVFGLGNDVGCYYGRLGADGTTASTLAIFSTRMAEGDTLQSAFEARQAEVAASMPTAVEMGPAIPPALAPPDETLSAQYSFEARGKPLLTDLVVAVKEGWQIKIQAIYSAAPEEMLLDSPGPGRAWLRALASVRAATP